MNHVTLTFQIDLPSRCKLSHGTVRNAPRHAPKFLIYCDLWTIPKGPSINDVTLGGGVKSKIFERNAVIFLLFYE